MVAEAHISQPQKDSHGWAENLIGAWGSGYPWILGWRTAWCCGSCTTPHSCTQLSSSKLPCFSPHEAGSHVALMCSHAEIDGRFRSHHIWGLRPSPLSLKPCHSKSSWKFVLEIWSSVHRTPCWMLILRFQYCSICSKQINSATDKKHWATG